MMASCPIAARAYVSVVIPCFRCADTIGRAVESVISQTTPPAEIILVDDASDDATSGELRQIAYRDERVRIVRHEKNSGVAIARNTGWDTARGRFVAFIDADASWHPRKLELQSRFMDQRPEVAVSGHLHLVTPETAAQVVLEGEPPFRWILFNELLWRNRFITSSVMVRRDLPHRFVVGQRHMEDHRLWLEIARGDLRIARIELPLAAHHKPDFGAGGLSGDLLAMEQAELENYRALKRAGAIGVPMLAILTAWSLGKFARRSAIVALRRITG